MITADVASGPAPTTTPSPTGPTSAPGACGVKPTRIVGGSEVTPFSLPWQVAFVNRGSNAGSRCGGILIGDRHVLTAAHCTRSGGTYDVIVGEHSVTSSSDGTRHSVCSVIDHPNYSSSTNQYDIAIARLDTPVEIGPRAVPACLPPTSFGGDFLDDKDMTVSGWGRLTSGGATPTALHSVVVPGISNDACNNAYSAINPITSDMICAGRVPGGGVDSCQGDSGGPLTYTADGRTYAVGVVSWGVGCAHPDYPGVYCRVTEVLDWINSELGNTCSS